MTQWRHHQLVIFKAAQHGASEVAPIRVMDKTHSVIFLPVSPGFLRSPACCCLPPRKKHPNLNTKESWALEAVGVCGGPKIINRGACPHRGSNLLQT